MPSISSVSSTESIGYGPAGLYSDELNPARVRAFQERFRQIGDGALNASIEQDQRRGIFAFLAYCLQALAAAVEALFRRRTPFAATPSNAESPLNSYFTGTSHLSDAEYIQGVLEDFSNFRNNTRLT